MKKSLLKMQEMAQISLFSACWWQWNQSGAVFTSNLNGNNYWSMVMVPQEEVNLIEFAEEYSNTHMFFLKILRWSGVTMKIILYSNRICN